MLRDSPDCVVMQAQWKVLEDALQRGQTRSIGVINFCQSALECLLQTAHVTPAVNYYMCVRYGRGTSCIFAKHYVVEYPSSEFLLSPHRLHVGMGRDAHGLRAFGESKGIRSFAYGAVGEPGPDAELLNSPIISRIGQAHDIKSPEEVALRWVLQTGAAASVRPTLAFGLGTSMCDGSTDACLDGLSKRASSFGWSLTDAEMDELDAMTSPDDNPTLFSSAGCPGAFVMPK
jgi:diketogulonate reductase-like aldo/keto reductase